MVGKLYKCGAGPILRPRKLRIGHEDANMQVSIKTIVEERGKFSITFNCYSGLTVENGVFMETFLLSLTIVLIDTCVFSSS